MNKVFLVKKTEYNNTFLRAMRNKVELSPEELELLEILLKQEENDTISFFDNGKWNTVDLEALLKKLEGFHG